MTLEYLRWLPVMRFGWTLEQADALTLAELQEYLEVNDGLTKAAGFIRNRAPRPRRR